MHWRNTNNKWGSVAITLHWLTALVVFGLFGLGLYMTDLNLYHPWYHKAPHLHRSIGVLLFLATLARFGWRLWNPPPSPLATHLWWEKLLARLVHGLLYLLLFAVMISGYLISTADGRGIEVFNWLTVPATLSGQESQEEIAGSAHLLLASTLIAFALLHAGAALKHHFIDRDCTLRRMLGL
jgi:cytochrome b561